MTLTVTNITNETATSSQFMPCMHKLTADLTDEEGNVTRGVNLTVGQADYERIKESGLLDAIKIGQ